MSPADPLVVIKVAHTAIWAVMATAILAIPVLALRAQFRPVAWLTVLIVVECIVLALNHGRCPLTDMAAQFTTTRTPNFDIYLPPRLAEHNKTIFGGLFVAGELVWLCQWLKRESVNKNGVTRK